MRFRVFGSRAKGTHRPNSDIDVLVECEPSERDQIDSVLKFFSIEQGGPLDLFCLGSADNEVDLIAYYSVSVASRVAGVGGEEDLDDLLRDAYEVSLQDLLALCETVDPIWQEGTSLDRAADKARSRSLSPRS